MENDKPLVTISDLEFADLNPKESAPVFSSVRGKDWIPYLTSDGNKQYPDKLIELMNNSALHGAILQSKTDQVAGNGFVWDEGDLEQEDSTKMALWMSNINPEEDANEVLWKLSTDLELFGGVAILVTWTKDWSAIGSIRHIDFSKVRAHTVNDQGVIPGYWYSWDWSKQRADKILIPAFNEGTAAENKKAYEDAVKKGNSQELQAIFLQPTTQIFVYKPYRPNSFYYPLPEYVGGISAIETDILSDQYGVASFQNGLNTNIIVTFFDLNTEEAQNKEARKFLKAHTGASKSNKPIIAFAKSQETALKIDSISASKEDKLFMTINENTVQKILSAHRITDPILVGLKVSGAGFNGGESLQLSIDYWNRTVIIPQQLVLTKIWNKFTAINDLPVVSIEPLTLFLDPADVEDDGQEAGNNNEIKTEMDRMIKVANKDGIKKKHTVQTKKQISKTIKDKNLDKNNELNK
jgi:hypothetical protein